MAAEKSVTYLFDVLSWRASRPVQRMTWAQRGMYREMLDEQRDKGSLPDCPRACAELLGGTEAEWIEHWPVLRRNFVDRRHQPRAGDSEVHDPNDRDPSRRIVNVRMARTMRERRAYLRSQQAKGKMGGLAKSQKRKDMQPSHGLATAKPVLSLESREEESREEEKRVGGRDSAAPLTLTQRAGAFCEWYAETHERIIGVGYIGNPNRDYIKAQELAGLFTDEELRDAAMIWFGQTDRFATDGTRTISKFGSRASDLVLRARRVSA
jgi:hypothetical protein